MKTIGLIGGLSWESSLEYYRRLNQAVSKKLGGLHSAKILMYSVDFAEVERNMNQGNWKLVGETISNVAKRLEAGGADFIMIGSNTIHKVAPQVMERVSLPLHSIIDATAEALVQEGKRKTIFLGTKYTMTDSFFVQGLKQYGLEVITPNVEEIELLNAMIFNELCLGIFEETSKSMMIKIINRLAKETGADSVSFACTELGLLVKQSDLSLPIYDTLVIHVETAIKKSFSN